MNIQKRYQQPQKQPVEKISPPVDYGLTEQQVRQRREAGWANVASDGPGRSEREIILGNLFTFFNLIFIILAVLLLLSGSSIKNCTFLVVVVCNVVIGCIQEIRAKRAVDKLTLVARKPVRVLRDGKLVQLQPEDLVRDDLVEFGPGDPICADAMVRQGALQVNESLITGEADAIEKTEGSGLRSGSFVIAGRGEPS